MNSALYYECHITFEPVFGEKLETVKLMAKMAGFSVADLLMQKRAEDTPERSKFDTFATTRGKNYEDVQDRMEALIAAFKVHGVKVWRYKIEDTIMDSKIEDKLNLLEAG